MSDAEKIMSLTSRIETLNIELRAMNSENSKLRDRIMELTTDKDVFRSTLEYIMELS